MEPHPRPVMELQDDQLEERLKLLVELLDLGLLKMLLLELVMLELLLLKLLLLELL